MGRSNRGYGGYRGRRTATDILRYIAITLGVLVLLLAAALLVGRRFLVYGEDGPQVVLPPFLSGERPQGSASEPEQPVETGQPERGVQEIQEPLQPEESPMAALQLDVNAVLNKTAAQQLEAAGADALVLEMKDQSGALAWRSAQAVADRARVNGDAEVNKALEEWNAGEVYTIARVCCFRDDSVPYYRNTMALRQGNGNWRDELGLRWMSPAQPDAQAYVAGLCGELAALGFDEIVLEHFGFPTQGELDKITTGSSYDPEAFTEDLERFLEQVRQALEPYDTMLSLRVERETLAGTEDSSGLTVDLLESSAGRLWMKEDGLLPAPAELLEQAGITEGEERLVSIVSALDEQRSAAQAILSDSEP